MPKTIQNKLIAEFRRREYFTREELFEFFKYFQPDLKEGTFAWRIHNLKNKNIIRSLGRGLYTISRKPLYEPVVSSELLRLNRKTAKKYEDLKYCIWEAYWMDEFLQQQSNNRVTIVEIEKEFVESLYYYLKDNLKSNICLYFNRKEIEFYRTRKQNTVIIKKLITRSPIEKRIENKAKLYVPFLEKILVDLYVEKLFYFYQETELKHIYENAFNQYTINFTRLLSYAKRREKEHEIKAFVTNNMRYLMDGYLIKSLVGFTIYLITQGFEGYIF